MKLEEIWNEIEKFQNVYFPKWKDIPLIYWTNALAGEVGEACNIAKHIVGGGTLGTDKKEEAVKLMRELGDIFVYFVLLSKYLGIEAESFEKIYTNTMKRNRSRWYSKRSET